MTIVLIKQKTTAEKMWTYIYIYIYIQLQIFVYDMAKKLRQTKFDYVMFFPGTPENVKG